MMKSIKITLFMAFLSLNIAFWSKLYAQTATVTVKTKVASKGIIAINCYWTEDNFEFNSHIPLQKQIAKRKGNRYTITFDNDLKFRNISFIGTDKDSIDKLFWLDYLICPGDQVVILDDGHGGLSFRGKGSEKFTLQYKLAQIEKTFVLLNKQQESKMILPSPANLSPVLYDKLVSSIKYNYAKRDSQFVVLNAYKRLLNSELYSLFKLNVIGRSESNILTTLHMQFNWLSKKYPELEDQKHLLLQTYTQRGTGLDNLKNAHFHYANDMQLYFMLRFRYADWLGSIFEDEWHENTIDKDLINRALYRHFYTSYAKMDSLKRQQVISQISDASYKRKLESFLKNISNGVALPNFQFQDSLGNPVHLADFKGKYVLLDFWYTGCGNCRILNKNLKPIKEQLKDRKDLVFVNVSIDGNFAQWKASVASGAYTDSTDVSLYTMGQKSNHPIIKFLNVMSYPRQLLVDKEMRIISTQIPRVGNAKNDLAFSTLIAKLK